jgi:hypothetical protein
MKGGKIMKNKKGLSDIVVTLIIIVLSLVAVGVVWAVVNNLLKGGSAGVDINAKCLGLNLQITQANCSLSGVSKMCDVQVARSGTTSDSLAGVKLVFRNITSGVSSSSAIDVPGDIPVVAGMRITYRNSTLNTTNGGIDTVEITPYFKDTSGNVQLCSQTSSFTFVG